MRHSLRTWAEKEWADLCPPRERTVVVEVRKRRKIAEVSGRPVQSCRTSRRYLGPKPSWDVDEFE